MVNILTDPQEEQETQAGAGCLLTNSDEIWALPSDSDTADYCDNDCEILK